MEAGELGAALGVAAALVNVIDSSAAWNTAAEADPPETVSTPLDAL